MNMLQVILGDRALSLNALAAAIGRTRRTLFNWRTGRTHPSAADIERVSQALGIPAETLLAAVDIQEAPANG